MKNYDHTKMIVWQNLDKIEEMVNKTILPKIPKNYFSLLDQTDRACSSSVANFIEGYYSSSINEYVRFLKYSKRSLAELLDWGRRCYHKSIINKETYDRFHDTAIKTLYLLNRLIYSLKGNGRPKKAE